MKKLSQLLGLLFLTLGINGQQSVVQNVPFTNIGPTIMSGRIVDIAVNPDKPTEFYAAYASGGVWYTNNNGTSFTPVSDNAATSNIGDIDVDWNSGTIWVGTGESNSSRSSYAGIGILKSTNRGKTWENVGLTDSHHVGRVIIDKKNPDIVVVGVIGHLYTPNAERGIFKTTDGGKTWKNVLFINENTGAIDISVSPENSDIMYAATWERIRKAWNFDGDGEGSAIYKSIDGGTTWTKLTVEGSGFPTGSGVGRIGVAAFNDDVVYALLDNQYRRPEKKKKKESGLKKDDFNKMSKEEFSNLNDKELNAYLRKNKFDRKHTAKSVKASVKKGKIQPNDLAAYLEDAISVITNSSVIGAEVYKSIDGGKTWKKTHNDYLDDVYSSYGYYFGIIAVNKAIENKVYIGGVPLLRSDDGGKNWISIGKENVHGDHQALWINPKNKGHIINGNDGGLNITYDDGENWIKNNAPSVGQFYAINVDNQKPYNVYGGLQDNGVWYGPANYKASKSWKAGGKYPYQRIGGGDGMQVQIDSRDNNIVYSGFQFGFYYRVNLNTNERIFIRPKHELGGTPYRYNWQTPILLSSHNQDIMYMGANKLLRSMDMGESFEVISDDLTMGGKKGNVANGTLTTFSESPFQFGMIYSGSDDGYVYLTKNGGADWMRISNSLPQELWVSRVIASEHEKERVFLTLNGYRNDDFKPYIYVSEDMGTTWKNIQSNLPDSPINVVREDPVDENILYVGNDSEVYVTFNRGAQWQLLSKGLPKVAVHDLAIQKRDKDLLVGTHGRSIYKANIAALQEYNTIKSKDIAILEIPKVRYSSRWGNQNRWSSPTEYKFSVPFYVSTSGNYKIEILSEDETVLYSKTVKATKGFNYFDEYRFRIDEKIVKNYFAKKDIIVSKSKKGYYYLPRGSYFVRIADVKQKFILK